MKDIVQKQDTDGSKGLLGKAEFGFDNYSAGGDQGALYIGTGTKNRRFLTKKDLRKWHHTLTLDNPNAYDTSENDQFGQSVGISGNYAIVGAYQEDDEGGLTSGKAYIFDVTTGSLLHTLDNPNAYSTSENDQFGCSVGISGNYAIVGAYLEDEDEFGWNAGKAYIYDVTTGSLVHTLDDPNAYSTGSADQFGYSVGISGNYAIVGAVGETSFIGDYFSGKAYIFEVTTGSLLHTLDNPNAYSTSKSDNFGYRVAISGNYCIVSAYEDDAGGDSSGKAYIYDVTTGTHLYTLDNPNVYYTSAYDYFGNSVAISGNYAIIGAYNEDAANNYNAGKAYIYDVTTGSLVHTLDNPSGYSTAKNDQFGASVAISGNYAIVGAYYEDDASGTDSGKAYIYDVTTGTLLHTLDNPNAYSTSYTDWFGSSVAMSGNYAIVGARFEDDAVSTSAGKVYIFKTIAPYV